MDNPKAHIKPVDANQLPLEFMMNALRLRSGVPIEFFSKRTGLSADSINGQIVDLQRKGLLKKEGANLCASDLGYRFLNSLLQHFS